MAEKTQPRPPGRPACVLKAGFGGSHIFRVEWDKVDRQGKVLVCVCVCVQYVYMCVWCVSLHVCLVCVYACMYVFSVPVCACMCACLALRLTTLEPISQSYPRGAEPAGPHLGWRGGAGACPRAENSALTSSRHSPWWHRKEPGKLTCQPIGGRAWAILGRKWGVA